MRNIGLKIIGGVFAALYGTLSFAQTQSTEILGTVTANQVSNGLGFNIAHPEMDWQWAAAAAAGATHARIDCQWAQTEQQTAPPLNRQASTPYVENSSCASGFASAAKYGIHPTVVAAFGAPYHQILTVTVPNGASVGATSIDVEFQSGVGGDTLANIAFPYDYIQGPPSVTSNTYGKLSWYGSYAGTLITGITLTDPTHGKLSLASAMINILPAGSTQYTINEILYPSALTTGANDPSVAAYGNYVSFLADDMAAHGLTGDVELWNEPPWLDDPWDDRGYLYDADLWPGPQSPGPNARIAVNWGFPANLQNKVFPAGVTLTWNGTSGSGIPSLLGTSMYQNTGFNINQPSTVITKESFHPYGNTPEEANWTTSCLEAAAAATSYPANDPYNCLLSGESSTNFINAAFLDAKAKLKGQAFGIGHSATETGGVATSPGYQLQQARFIVRHYLAYQADGVTPVELFELNAPGPSDPTYSFVEEIGSTGMYTPNPDYTAISGLMADIKPVSNLPVAPYPASTLPSVVSYSGTYPLTSVHMVGSRAGASANSDMFAVWQRSYTPCAKPGSGCGSLNTWMQQASPAAAPATISIPAGMSVTEVVNATTRASVAYTRSGQQITLNVADDPIEILVDPASDDLSVTPAQLTTLAVTSASVGKTYGTQVAVSAKLTPFSAKSHSTNGETVTFFNGSSTLGQAALTSGSATLNVSGLPTGTNTIVAQYGGDSNFASSVGYQTITITPALPTVSFSPVPTQVFGAAPIVVSATSVATGYITYSVVSGPARIGATTAKNATVQLTGAGTVVLQASQAATSNYLTATGLLTFVVSPAVPSLAFPNIPTKTFGNKPFTVTAYSGSSGAITYSMVSGPATMSGNTVTLTGSGTVTVQASQTAAGNYAATTAQTSFAVLGGNGIAFAPIANTTYGAAPFTVSASSPSSGAITYTVVSGPATISGNTVTLTGSGTVTIKASQAAAGSYGASTAQTSFTVSAETAKLAFAPIANATYGAAPFTVSATSSSSGAITYTVASGPATISGNTITVTGPGTVTLQASQAAAGSYSASTAQTSFTVSAETPTLAFAPIANTTYGSAPFTVSATSSSSGAITYTVASGPATISGTTVKLTGSGTVTLKASQAAAGNYAAATAQTGFTVGAETPKLTFAPVANATYGAAPFPVSATSSSSGAITYTVASGPATISGNTVTVTGPGTVTLQANQAATADYTAASAQAGFTVSAAAGLAFTPVSEQVWGNLPFLVTATSPSPAYIAYSVVSGPVRIGATDSSAQTATIQLLGVGEAVLQATQAASGKYPATTVQTAFVIDRAVPPLAFTPVTPKILGQVQPFTVGAYSHSAGAITYSIVSGPATIAGNTVTLTGTGVVTLQAKQAPQSVWTAASAQTSFMVTAP